MAYGAVGNAEAASKFLSAADTGYHHDRRQAVFVGDFIDRGQAQLRVRQTVKDMVDAGSAQLVLGNHEFNALAYATEWPYPRQRARVRWRDSGASTLREIAEMVGGFTTPDGAPYPPLPEQPMPASRAYRYTDQVPVCYGHYWRRGTPEYTRDWTDYTACVDFSAVKGGSLMTYRWSGEPRIDPAHYVSVPAVS